MKKWFALLALILQGCSSLPPVKTVDQVEIPRFMGKWYVLGGRFTFLEKDVHNGIEVYTWNEEKKRIDIDFTFLSGGFDGAKKSLPQKGWIENSKTWAHWKVSPFWPLKFDYLVLALAEDYSWTVIGVPNQKYFWIMARDWKNPEAIVTESLRQLQVLNYDVKNYVLVPHRH